jgi:glycosyltransferase involved in cell wall biosynthesis
MHVGVVTPVRDGASLIGETIKSIRNQRAVQSGRVHVTYVIQDGASTDATVPVARSTLDDAPAALDASIESAPDSGMYDALATGFERVGACDWYAYLNAGDLWDPSALDVLADVHEQTDAKWLCGLQAYFAADSSLVHTRLPFRFTRPLLRAGAYGRGLPTVQQESTFWRQDLQKQIDWSQLRQYRYAGDSYLWWTFAADTEPVIIQALLGGFRYHGGHLGVSKDAYAKEINRFAGPMSLKTRLQIPANLVMWEQPARIKARFNPNLYLHSTETGGWVSARGSITRLSLA